LAWPASSIAPRGARACWLVDQRADPEALVWSRRPSSLGKAEGDTYRHLRQLADRINTPRLIVRPQECGEWRGLIASRIPDRLHRED